MLEEIRQLILDRQLLVHGERFLVGVSGGPDSVVLLDILAALQPEFRWQLQVVHFNHQLRGTESDGDEAFVRDLAAGYGIPFNVGRGDVKAFADREKLSIEDAARRLRHQFFQETGRALGIEKIALGHHADDQVETLLQRLLRGAGSHGLAAIHLTNRLNNLVLVRPLLESWRNEILHYARHRALKFRQDSSNSDPQFQRNKIRHELIPLLQQQYNPALKPLLRQTTAQLAAEDEWMETETLKILQTCRTGPRSLLLSPLRQQPVALQRRLLYRWLLENSIGEAVNFRTIELLRQMIGTGQPAQTVLGAQWQITITTDRLSLEPAADQASWEIIPPQPIRLSGTTELADWGMDVETRLVTGDGIPTLPQLREPRLPEAPREEWLDADAVGESLSLRSWQPGDRFQPIGMKSSKKLQDIFVDEQIPVALRHQIPLLVAADGEICWIVGYRPGERFKITPATRQALQIRLRPRPAPGTAPVTSNRRPSP